MNWCFQIRKGEQWHIGCLLQWCDFSPAILFFQSVFAMVKCRNVGDKMNLIVKVCTQARVYIICALQWGNTKLLHWIILNFIMSF